MALYVESESIKINWEVLGSLGSFGFKHQNRGKLLRLYISLGLINTMGCWDGIGPPPPSPPPPPPPHTECISCSLLGFFVIQSILWFLCRLNLVRMKPNTLCLGWHVEFRVDWEMVLCNKEKSKFFLHPNQSHHPERKGNVSIRFYPSGVKKLMVFIGRNRITTSNGSRK